MSREGADEQSVVQCTQCGWSEVPLGPRGGYVCPVCFHTEVPTGPSA